MVGTQTCTNRRIRVEFNTSRAVKGEYEVISPGRTATEADIAAFAALTGDYRSPELTLGRTSKKLDKGSGYGN